MSNAEQIHQDAQDALDAQCKFYAELVSVAQTVEEAEKYKDEFERTVRNIIEHEEAAIMALGDNDGTHNLP